MENAVSRYTRVDLVPFNIDLLTCQWATLSDWHYKLQDPFWRIYWMDRKGWYVWHKEKPLALDPGHLAVIPANTPCRSESRSTATQFYVHFTLGSIFNPYKPGVYLLPLTRHAVSLITRLMNPEPSRPEQTLARTLRVKQLCYDCLSRLPGESLNANPYSPKITSVMEAMARNLKEPFSNTEMAKSAGMNTNAFIRLFHRESGQSPQKWYTEKRINRAALLLSHSAKTIEEIAEETAFFDRNHFSRVFKKFKGTGPAAYRRRSENRR